MKKSKVTCALSAVAVALGSGILAPVGAWAEGTITTFGELDAALCAGGSYMLGADIAADNWLGSGCSYKPNKDFTLDFNGYTVTSAGDKGYNLDFYDGVLTFKDSKGTGGYTQLGSNNVAIAITNGKFVLDGGNIQNKDWGVVLWHDSEMEMNGGSIITDTDSAISGNGTTNPENSNYGANTKITINDGTIRSEGATGIYHPQKDGVFTVNGGTIYGHDTGIEIRAGSLTINGGDISSADGVIYDAKPNGSGSTTKGAAVAVAQHTTKLPLSIVIAGSEFSGPVAFSEQNPQENGEDALSQITTSIAGGKFVGTSEEPVVVSEDVKHFISGGGYNKVPVQEYLKDGYTTYSDGTEEVPYAVAEVGQINLPADIYLKVGETYNLASAINESGFTYGEFDEGNLLDYVTVNDEYMMTAVAPGTATVRYNLVDAYEQGFGNQTNVVVYATSTALDSDASGVVDAIVGGGAADNFEYAEGITAADIVSAAGNTATAITSKVVDASDIEAGVADAITEEVGESLPESAELAGYYDIDVELLAVTGDATIPLGYITKLSDAVTITVTLPKDLEVVKDGYNRTYYMVRYHNGDTKVIEAVDNGDGTISFDSDSFSTYALVYVDEVATAEEEEISEEVAIEAESPETGTMTAAGASASVAGLMTAVAVGVITAITSFAYLVRRED